MDWTRKIPLLLALVLFLPVQARPLEPVRRSVMPLERVRLREMPRVDVERLLREDEVNRQHKERPLRVGHPVATDLSPANSGTWEDLPDGDRLWRLRVRSARARWIVLGFGTFRLQAGGRLTVYDPARRTVLGPFGAAQVRGHGQLWLPPVDGDTLVLELYWPAKLRNVTPNIHLGNVSHGYKDAWLDPAGDASAFEAREPVSAGPCNIDVSCPLGDDWRDPARGVVQLLKGGFAYCSGSLINTTANDCRPYVLTANHCVSTQSDAASTTFRFDYERPVCESGSAPTDRTTTGSTLLAAYAPSDFTLLELDGEIPAEVDPLFNGWNRSSDPAAESWSIHHPGGAVKKISYNADPLVPGQSSGWGASHWRVTEWEQGTTESGSSGSPLFDADRRIVGQLHGGKASCENPSWDEYGKLVASWTGGGDPASRLADWLDPQGSGATFVDGVALSTCSNPARRLSVAATHVVEDEGNGDGVLDPGERFSVEIGLRNDGSEPATKLVGSLSTDSSQLTIDHATAEWPDIPQGSVRSSLAPHFKLDIARRHPCGEPVVLRLDLSVDGSTAYPVQVALPTGSDRVRELFRDDMDSGVADWISKPPLAASWALTISTEDPFDASWHASDSAEPIDTSLIMPLIADLPPQAALRFRHRFNTENNRDGGVLEYRVEGGTWTDLGFSIPNGGYNSSIADGTSSPLAGRPAWAGDSEGWQTVEADLSSLEGADLQLRWRFATNASISDEGWYVDDVVVEATSHDCTPLDRNPSPRTQRDRRTDRPAPRATRPH